MNASRAYETWSQLLDQVCRRETRVLVEKSGVPVAALGSAEELARLQQLDARRAEEFQALDAMRAAFADVPDDELQREVDHAVAAVRAKRRVPASARSSRLP